MVLSKNKQTIILILIAFIFSFAIRLIWVEQFNSVEQFKFNNQFMINTNDGYFYAEGARDILSGISQEHDLSAIKEAASQLTALIAKLLPFSFETIIFYMLDTTHFHFFCQINSLSYIDLFIFLRTCPTHLMH